MNKDERLVWSTRRRVHTAEDRFRKEQALLNAAVTRLRQRGTCTHPRTHAGFTGGPTYMRCSVCGVAVRKLVAK
jgi:hypothetical protein